MKNNEIPLICPFSLKRIPSYITHREKKPVRQSRPKHNFLRALEREKKIDLCQQEDKGKKERGKKERMVKKEQKKSEAKQSESK